MDLRSARGLLDLLVGRLRAREPKVVPNRRVKEVRLLGDDPDRIRERIERQLPHVDAVDCHRAVWGVVEACHQIAGGGLSRAGLADECGLRSGGHIEGDVLQRPGCILVAEPDMVEGHVASRRIERPRPLFDVDRVVEVLEDAVEQRERGLHLERDAEQ